MVQVFELQAGMDSGAVWQEVCILRRCTHDRIVPLLGVAVKVRTGSTWCQPQRPLTLLKRHLPCLLPACLLPPYLPPLARLLVSGPAAAGSDGVSARRQPAGCPAATRDAARSAMESQVSTHQPPCQSRPGLSMQGVVTAPLQLPCTALLLVLLPQPSPSPPHAGCMGCMHTKLRRLTSLAMLTRRAACGAGGARWRWTSRRL